MPTLTLNSNAVANQLFDLGDTLKATIILSAAALLSRRTDDLEANAYSALARLEDMRQKLDGVRNGVAQKKDVSLATRLKRQIKKIDNDAFTDALSLIDGRLESYRNALLSVLESKQRENIDLFVPTVGALGRAIQAAIGLVAGDALTGSPLLFDALFAQAMEELSEKSWENGTS